MPESQTVFNFIDLFAGAGGLSEGFIQAGFNPIAHVEMNAMAAQTLETRAAFHYLSSQQDGSVQFYYAYERGEITREELFEHVPAQVIATVINEELSDKSIKRVFKQIDKSIEDAGVGHIDVIVGGPPCQAYSLVGRAQSSHMLVPMDKDPRNELYKMYTRFLTRYKPEMFVFENVAGIKSARGGAAYKNLQAHLKRVGYDFECREQNAADFGVLQSRKRVIIIGWRKGTEHFYPDFVVNNSEAIVNDLLVDLAPVNRGEENNAYALPYDECSDYLKESGIRTPYDVVTHHMARPNCDRDIQIYGMAIDAWNDGEQRLSYDKLPEELRTHKNTTSFKDRFKVVEGNKSSCHTVLAHLAKDGHYFIHPDRRQCRSITVREAARLQTFPDSYYFEGSRGEKFKQIGNAVPPMMAKVIAEAIRDQL